MGLDDLRRSISSLGRSTAGTYKGVFCGRSCRGPMNPVCPLGGDGIVGVVLPELPGVMSERGEV